MKAFDISDGVFTSGRTSLMSFYEVSGSISGGTNLTINNDTLTGTLADGSDLNVLLNLYNSGTVNFVPEPSSVALLNLGALAILRCRR